jgi:hypothetical protein
MRLATFAGALPALVVVGGLAGCGSVAAGAQASMEPSPDCRYFALSLVSDRGGQATPVEAATWFVSHGVILPSDVSYHWVEVGRDGAEASVRSGDLELHAFKGTDATWQVDSGQTC